MTENKILKKNVLEPETTLACISLKNICILISHMKCLTDQFGYFFRNIKGFLFLSFLKSCLRRKEKQTVFSWLNTLYSNVLGDLKEGVPIAGPPHLESKAAGWRRVQLCLFQLVAQGEAVMRYCRREELQSRVWFGIFVENDIIITKSHRSLTNSCLLRTWAYT